jgi:hypothetical protein
MELCVRLGRERRSGVENRAKGRRSQLVGLVEGAREAIWVWLQRLERDAVAPQQVARCRRRARSARPAQRAARGPGAGRAPSPVPRRARASPLPVFVMPVLGFQKLVEAEGQYPNPSPTFST